MCDGRYWCGRTLDFVAAADPSPSWGGMAFASGPVGTAVPGIYLYGRRDGERVYAVYVGETEDIAQAMTALAEAREPRLAQADRFYWMRENDPLVRRLLVDALVACYDPPGNADGAATVDTEAPADDYPIIRQ